MSIESLGHLQDAGLGHGSGRIELDHVRNDEQPGPHRQFERHASERVSVTSNVSSLKSSFTEGQCNPALLDRKKNAAIYVSAGVLNGWQLRRSAPESGRANPLFNLDIQETLPALQPVRPFILPEAKNDDASLIERYVRNRLLHILPSG